MVESLKTESLIAQRSVQDFINASEVSRDGNGRCADQKLPGAVNRMYKQAVEDKKGGNWRWEVPKEKFDFTRDRGEVQEAGVAMVCCWFREEGWKILWQSWKRSLHWIYDEGNSFWNTVKEKKETNIWPCFISWRTRKRQKFSLRSVWVIFVII